MSLSPSSLYTSDFSESPFLEPSFDNKGNKVNYDHNFRKKYDLGSSLDLVDPVVKKARSSIG